MGAIFDEETGEEPSCMFCDGTEECSHLLADIDHTFNDCAGGTLYVHIGDLREILLMRVRSLLECKIKSKPRGDLIDKEIYRLIKEAVEGFDPEYPEEVSVDEYEFLELLVELFIAAGADEHPGHMVEEGGPGQSSRLTLLYAENPDEVIKAVKERLRRTVAKI